MFVKIEAKDQKIAVVSPYYPAFIEAARALAGKWNPNAGAWMFDPRDAERVKAICDEHYGEHGEEVQRVTLRLDLNCYPLRGNVDYFAGRQIFQRFDRDSRVKLGEGVVLVSGGFYSSGGSRKNPILGEATENSVAEVRDVPLVLAKKCAQIKGVSILEALEPEAPLMNLEGKVEGSGMGLGIAEIAAVAFPSTMYETYEGPAYEPENRPLTVEEAKRMFEAKDNAQAQRDEWADRIKREAAEGERVMKLTGFLNYCEFTAVHCYMNEVCSLVECNLAHAEAEGDQSTELGDQVLEDLAKIAQLSANMQNAIKLNAGKIPSEKCGACDHCEDEKREAQEEVQDYGEARD